MNNGCSVFTVAAAIVFVPVDYEESAADDLKNSILFAQLVANKRFLKKPKAYWFVDYAGVLDDFWVRTVKYRQDITLEKNSSTTPIQWASQLMAHGSDDEVLPLAAFSEWVARLPATSPEVNLLRSQVQEVNVGEERLASATAKTTHLLVILAQKPASMICLCLEFKTRQTVEGNPWTQHFQADLMDGHVSARYFRARLSETLYALYRDAIAAKIKERVSGNVLSFAEVVDLSTVLPREERGS